MKAKLRGLRMSGRQATSLNDLHLLRYSLYAMYTIFSRHSVFMRTTSPCMQASVNTFVRNVVDMLRFQCNLNANLRQSVVFGSHTKNGTLMVTCMTPFVHVFLSNKIIR